MSKKLIALTLTAALTLSSIVPAFAEESISANAQAAKDLGMLKGANSAGVTVEYTKTAPTRLQAAILFLRLKGLENAALSYTGIDNFADAKDVVWAQGKNVMAYLKAHPELGWTGIGNDKFNPNAQVDAKSYYKVMLEALGYKQNTADVIGDFTWDNIVAFAASKGLDDVMSVANFTVDNVATATIEALKAAIKGSEKTLAASLVEAKIINEDAAVAAGVYTAPAVTLSVKSVSTDNLKNLVITFNKAIDKSTATTTTIKVYNGSTPIVIANPSVSADNKTVTLVNNSTFNQNDTIKVVVDGIKDATGATMAKAENTVTVKDVADPVINKITVINNKKIEINASEPINVDTNGIYKTTDLTNSGMLLKVDGALTFAKFTAVPAENKVVVDFLNPLADGTHTISIADVRDFTGFKAATVNFTVTTVSDTTAPNAVAVNYVSKNTIEVTFNEEVNAATGTFKVYQAGDATDLFAGGSKAIKSDDNKTIVLTLGTSMNVAATVGLDVKYSNVQDTFGNKNATEIAVSGKAIDDTIKPAIASYEVLAGNIVKVTFTEKVNAAGQTAKFALYKEDGTTVVNASAVSVVDYDSTTPDGKTFKVTFAGLNSINAANFKVKVTGIKDLSIRDNVMDDYTFAIAAKDAKAPSLVTAVLVADATGNNDKIELVFSEAVDASLATNIANYFVGNGAATIAANTISGAKVDSISADGKKVVLLVPDADNSDVAAGLSAVVNRVAMPALKDMSGNYIDNASIGTPFTVSTSYTAMASTDMKVEAIGKNTLKVTALNGYTFTNADANTFKFEKISTNGTNVYDLGVVAAQVSQDGTYITLTTAVALSADAMYNDSGLKAIDMYITGTTTKDMNGQSVSVAQANSVAVQDKISASQTTVVADKDANTITYSFDEAIQYIAGINDDIMAAGIQIVDGTTTLIPSVDYTVAVSGNNLVITITKANVDETTAKVTINRANLLQDSNGNTVVLK